MSESPTETAPEVTEQVPVEDAPLELEGLTDGMLGNVVPEELGGPPEPASAVDEIETAEIPVDDPAKDTSAKAEAKAEDDTVESKVEESVNFDGFSDSQKTTFEGLLEGGHITKEMVEEVRLGSLRQSDYTKKTMALADKRKASEAEDEQNKDDLALLAEIREKDHLHQAWLKLSQGDFDEDGDSTVDDEDLVDMKTAKQLVQDALDAKEKAVEAKTSAEDQAYQGKQNAITVAMQESMELHSVDAKTMEGYLEAEEALLPEGTDPILTIPPAEWQRRISARHDKSVLENRIAELEAQVSGKTSKAARTAKQSQAPARSVVDGGRLSHLQQMEADLGVAPDWSNVTGTGNHIPGGWSK